MEDRSGAACMSRLRLVGMLSCSWNMPGTKAFSSSSRRIWKRRIQLGGSCLSKFVRSVSPNWETKMSVKAIKLSKSLLTRYQSQAGKRKSQLELQEVPDELRQYTLPRNRIAHLQETTQIQQSELDGLRKEHGRLQGKIEGQENEIQGLKEKCTDLENESSGLKDQSSAYQSVGVDEQQDPRLSREGSPVTMADIQVRKDSTAEKKRMNDELAQAIEDEDEEIQRGLKLKRARTSGVSR